MSFNTERLKLELRRARTPFAWLVWLFVAFAVTMAIIFSNLNYERPFEERYKVDVAFQSVKGVFPGQHPVRIAGVQVGVVSDAKVRNGQGVLTLSLEEQYAPIYKDAKLRIRPQTPLQDMYIAIDDRGTPAAGELRPGETPLPAEQSTSPQDISRILNTFDSDTRKRMATLLDGLRVGLDERGDDLNRAFAEIAPFLHAADTVSDVMSRREKQMRRIVTNFGHLSDALAKRDRQLTALITEGSSTFNALADARSPLAQTIRELPPLMDTIRSSFASLRAAQSEVDPALRAMLPAANELEKGLEGLREFSEDATPAFRALQPAMRDLRPLARVLRPTSTTLERALERLTPQAPRFDKITREVVPCLDSGSRFFQDTLSVTKFGTPFGAIPRGASSQGTSGFESTPDSGLEPITFCTGRKPR